MGANRGGAWILTPPTLQRPEPSLLRAVSCPHGCVASHAHPIDFGTQGADRDLASSQCPLTLARVAFPLFPWTTGRGPAEGTGCVRVSSSFPFLLSERLVATSFVRLAWLFPPTCPKSPHLSFAPLLFSFRFLLSCLHLPLLSPALLISLPQHPVPSLWCALVLAKARPGRTDG